MANGMYLGVSNTAKSVTSAYIGIGGVAKEISKIYTGDANGLAREVYSAEPPIPLKTFSAATEEELVQMVTAADNGLIDLYDDAGWRVGQERTVNIDAIAKTGTYDGISWSVKNPTTAQTITLVLMHRGLYELVTPVKAKGGSTRNTCSFIVGMKDCLAPYSGELNSTNTYAASWGGCDRHNWCNAGFRSVLPINIRNCFKKFKTITGVYNGTSSGGTNIITEDYFTFAAEKEVHGTRTNSTNREANALTQFTWYTTASNKIKYMTNSQGQTNATAWWGRSAISNYDMYCQIVNNGGLNDRMNVSSSCCLSPFGVM